MMVVGGCKWWWLRAQQLETFNWRLLQQCTEQASAAAASNILLILDWCGGFPLLAHLLERVYRGSWSPATCYTSCRSAAVSRHSLAMHSFINLLLARYDLFMIFGRSLLFHYSVYSGWGNGRPGEELLEELGGG